MMAELGAKPARIFVVWEPVLFTDWSSPSTATLDRIPDAQAAQFWDKERLISHSMGEHDRHSIVWDYIAVYPRGTVWEEIPPPALYHGNPVVQATEAARTAIARSLSGKQVELSEHVQR